MENIYLTPTNLRTQEKKYYAYISAILLREGIKLIDLSQLNIAERQSYIRNFIAKTVVGECPTCHKWYPKNVPCTECNKHPMIRTKEQVMDQVTLWDNFAVIYEHHLRTLQIQDICITEKIILQLYQPQKK